MGDAWFFDWFAPLYDRAMPAADPDLFVQGFDHATGDVSIVLDLAGGSGRIARTLDTDYDVAVCDLSRSMLTEARRHGLDAVQVDATRIPVRDASVDAVVIADAYHHLVDPERVVQDVWRVLRPGGVFVVQEFNPGTLRGRFIEIGERVLQWPCAFRRPNELVTDLEAEGFEASILEGGFEYTVVGTKPADQSNA